MKNRKLYLVILLIFGALCSSSDGWGQEFIPDANTSLLLHFNNDALDDATSEAPVSISNLSYQQGIFGNAASIAASTYLSYNAQNNILATQGTLETWIKPCWNGNDNANHFILIWGGSGGIFIGKDGGNYIKLLVNRFGANGNPEKVVSHYTGNWTADEWHHFACTWSSTELRLYIDGVLVDTESVGFTLPNIGNSTFDIGSENGNATFDGEIEEFRISNVVRTSAEIAQSYSNGLLSEDIVIKEDAISLFPTWRYKPELCITVGGSVFDANPAAFNWTSSNPAIAYVNSDGNVIAVAPGTASLVVNDNNSNTDALSVTVQTPVLAPAYPQEDPFLVQPASCSKELMRVLVLNYLPTQNGTHLDLAETGPDLGNTAIPLSSIENRLNEYNVQMKYMSEERTKFRGYKDPNADPYLGYQIVEYINIYEPVPRFHKVNWQGQANNFISYIDMPAIAERFDWQTYVDDLDIDEIWVWAYHNDTPGGVFGSESEMSSPTPADISNSWNFTPETNLPIYSKTYMVYWFNYGRTPNLHNHGHQLESIFGAINNNLFWNDFATFGRCGNDHQPPNTTMHYDYLNTTLVMSDIETWQPSGGTYELVNVDNWGNLSYDWPYGLIPNGEKEVNYYIYWMQNMPGYLNAIPYNSTYMSNWWQFLADWDTYNYLTANLFQGNQSQATTQVVAPCTTCVHTLNVTPYAFDGIYKATNFIESDAKIILQNNVIFRAGNTVQLKAGFEIPVDTDFEAIIQGCN